MLTIVACPKAFRGHVGVIQRNAMGSWTRLHPEVQVLVVGDDPGAGDAAAAAGAEHVPEVRTNDHGTPLISGIFAVARARARHEFLCYVNADIILLPDLLAAFIRCASEIDRPFLFGRRIDVALPEPLSFDGPWQRRLVERARTQGRPNGPFALDYFVFGANEITEVPDFAVGRPGWDQWLVYEAGRRGLTRVDIGAAVTVIHQDHDYSHHPNGSAGVWTGPEAARNAALMGGALGGYGRAHTTRDATLRLVNSQLRPNRDVAARVYRAAIDLGAEHLVPRARAGGVGLTTPLAR